MKSLLAFLLLLFAAPENGLALTKLSFDREPASSEIKGELAKDTYGRLPDEPDPSGEAELVKDGAIACWESGAKAPFAYSCDCGEEEGVDQMQGKPAAELYEVLPKSSQADDGEGGRIRHSDLQCFQKGVRDFTFRCQLR